MKLNSITLSQLTALLDYNDSPVSNLSNASAFLKQNIPNINWVGFYTFNSRTNCLDLGPFQGKVACVHIRNGQGVCDTAFSKCKMLNIPDVNKFSGHIACDENSAAELVIPLVNNHHMLGVLDLDSTIKDRFSKKDEVVISKAANIISQVIDK